MSINEFAKHVDIRMEIHIKTHVGRNLLFNYRVIFGRMTLMKGRGCHENGKTSGNTNRTTTTKSTYANVPRSMETMLGACLYWHIDSNTCTYCIKIVESYKNVIKYIELYTYLTL